MLFFLGKEDRTKSNFQQAERCLCAVFAVLMEVFSITQAEQNGNSAFNYSQTCITGTRS